MVLHSKIKSYCYVARANAYENGEISGYILARNKITHPIYIDNYILLIYKPAIESNVCNRQNTDECVFDSYSSC